MIPSVKTKIANNRVWIQYINVDVANNQINSLRKWSLYNSVSDMWVHKGVVERTILSKFQTYAALPRTTEFPDIIAAA